MPEVGVEAPASPDPKPLPRLGSYVLTKQLGSGGMSNVFKGVHDESKSVVAVKVLPRTLAKNPTLLQRFIKEAKSAEALDHPNIVAIYDRGFDQGRHYLILEYVEGRDLHDRVRLNGPMAPDEAIKLIRQVAEGLKYAASRGMIHRDIKPANLLVTPEGQAKIIDLGLALQADDEDERVTRDGTTVGTVDYMAPEQARDSRKTSERSDIYSLGCAFYYLLTGSAPFPGGNLADKLSRHHSAPPPDARERRPEVPETVAKFVQKMMAKKPEQRFADYSQLIEGLDRLLGLPSAAVPLDALIVDDDDDDDPPITAVRPSAPPVLMAEIVDDEDDDEDQRPSASRLSTPKPAREPAAPAEFSIADLAELDEKPPSRVTRRPSAAPSKPPEGAPKPGIAFNAMLEEAEEPVEGFEGPIRRRGDDVPLKTWIAAGLLVGLALALVGLGVGLLISYSKPAEPEIVTDQPVKPEPIFEPVIAPPVAPTRPGVVKASPKPKDKVKAQPKVTLPPPPVEIAREVPPPEKVYPKEIEARFSPPTAPPRPSTSDRPGVIVRRFPDAGEESQTTSIGSAFGRLGDVVEIADTGPFFEDNCQVAGKSRLIRGRAGLRPMIKVEVTSQPAVKEQEAKFVLGGGKLEHLVLEGLDIAVDVRDLPITQTSLFVCRGADLTLRDCSLTVFNAGDRPFSVFKLLDGPRPNRLVLDRTVVRGPIRTMVEVVGPKVELSLDRSIVVGDVGPMIVIEPAERAARTMYINRSVVASRGPIFEVSGAKTPPMLVRALGSTFARVDGAIAAALFHAKAPGAGSPSAWLDWSGEDNLFLGWPALLTTGPESSIRVDHLDALRSDWSGSDASSREQTPPIPASILRDDVFAADFGPIIPERKGTLAKVATPHPRLRELTVDSLRRLVTPELAAGLTATNGMSIPSVEMVFDVTAPSWQGDLGKFLAERVKEGPNRQVIRVRGSGVLPMTPVRLPDGVSVAIIGDSTEGARTALPTFVPTAEVAGRSLIELRGGDLAVANLAFSTDGAIRPKHWIESVDGILAVQHCRFRDPGGIDPKVGAVIAFKAGGYLPIAPRTGPLVAPTDRPTARLKNCLIWTGSDAISAEVGRGVLDLDNCLILSGGPAISMVPAKVPREKFEADVVLDRCTIVDDRAAIQLASWPGDALGPARPWLVSTHSCVFPKTQRDGAGGMLTFDPDSMVRGTLFWQSLFDVYEVGRFLASTGSQSAAAAPSADLKRQWIDLWGIQHTRNDRGPDPRRADHILRFKEKDRPKPGKYYPAAVELDPKSHKDLGVDFKNLPPAPGR